MNVHGYKQDTEIYNWIVKYCIINLRSNSLSMDGGWIENIIVITTIVNN